MFLWHNFLTLVFLSVFVMTSNSFIMACCLVLLVISLMKCLVYITLSHWMGSVLMLLYLGGILVLLLYVTSIMSVKQIFFSVLSFLFVIPFLTMVSFLPSIINSYWGDMSSVILLFSSNEFSLILISLLWLVVLVLMFVSAKLSNFFSPMRVL